MIRANRFVRIALRIARASKNGAKFPVFFCRVSLILADSRFFWEVQHLGGADFRRKPRESADFSRKQQESVDFRRNPFVPFSSFVPFDSALNHYSPQPLHGICPCSWATSTMVDSHQHGKEAGTKFASEGNPWGKRKADWGHSCSIVLCCAAGPPPKDTSLKTLTTLN